MSRSLVRAQRAREKKRGFHFVPIYNLAGRIGRDVCQDVSEGSKGGFVVNLNRNWKHWKK